MKFSDFLFPASMDPAMDEQVIHVADNAIVVPDLEQPVRVEQHESLAGKAREPGAHALERREHRPAPPLGLGDHLERQLRAAIERRMCAGEHHPQLVVGHGM